MDKWIQDMNTWLTTASPPNSYKIEIAYTDTIERHRAHKYSTDELYYYKDLSWMDTELRFPNYARANVYARLNYTPILYRISGSNDPPNYFKIDKEEIGSSKALSISEQRQQQQQASDSATVSDTPIASAKRPIKMVRKPVITPQRKRRGLKPIRKGK